MVKDMSPQQRHALTQLSINQQQLQVLVAQRQQLELQLKEIEAAMDELKKEEAEHVYKAIGPALIKKKREDVIKDLEEAREKLGLRIKTVKSSEKKLTEKIKELSSKLKG